MSIEIESIKMPRTAYKGKYIAWRNTAIIMASGWLFTLGVLAYVVNKYYAPTISPNGVEADMEVTK